MIFFQLISQCTLFYSVFPLKQKDDLAMLAFVPAGPDHESSCLQKLIVVCSCEPSQAILDLLM